METLQTSPTGYRYPTRPGSLTSLTPRRSPLAAASAPLPDEYPHIPATIQHSLTPALKLLLASPNTHASLVSRSLDIGWYSARVVEPRPRKKQSQVGRPNGCMGVLHCDLFNQHCSQPRTTGSPEASDNVRTFVILRSCFQQARLDKYNNKLD